MFEKLFGNNKDKQEKDWLSKLRVVTDKWAFLRATDAVWRSDTGGGAIWGVRLSAEHKLRELVLDERFKDLQHLYISDHSTLRTLTFAQPMPNLTHLYADNCALEKLVIPAGCDKLEQIYLQHTKESKLTKLQSIVFEGDCSSLSLLDVSNNALTDFKLPEGFGKLEYLYLEGNSLAGALANTVSAAAGKNVAADVLTLLRTQRIQTDLLPLRRAKMILIGNGEVGKTSIRLKLLDKDAILPAKADRTPVLIIEPYPIKGLPQCKGEDFELGIWDFGGQGRYREIQQLFCSRKALYLYVTSNKDTPDIQEDYVNADYWLQMVDAYSSSSEESHSRSPILHVFNKIEIKEGDGIPDEDAGKRGSVMKRYEIQQSIEIDCWNYKGFDDKPKSLKAMIVEMLPQISSDIFTEAYHKRWFGVLTALKELAKNWIERSEYEAICKEPKFNLTADEADLWLRILDRIGEVIYFGEHKTLKDVIVLNPTWVKEAIANLLDSDLIQSEGLLRPVYRRYVWQSPYTSVDYDLFIQLLEGYQLAYKYNDDGVFLVPSALHKKEEPKVEIIGLPRYEVTLKYTIGEGDKKKKFLPAGSVNKMTVRLHQKLYEHVVASGASFLHSIDNNIVAFAFVRESWQNSAVLIDLWGTNVQPFYEEIVRHLEDINKDIEKVKQLDTLSITAEIHRGGKWKNIENLLDEGIDVFNCNPKSEDSATPPPSTQPINISVTIQNDNKVMSENYDIKGTVIGSIIGGANNSVNIGSLTYNAATAPAGVDEAMFNALKVELAKLTADKQAALKKVVDGIETEDAPETEAEKLSALGRVGNWLNKNAEGIVLNVLSSAYWDCIKYAVAMYSIATQ